MLRHQKHKKQAKHNKGLLQEHCFPDPCTVKTVMYKDWNITVTFYVALHYIQSYLCKNRMRYGYRTNFRNHNDRNNYLARISVRDSRINQIVTDYIALFKASCIARYNPCSYKRLNNRDLCDYEKFASQDLPKALGI